jgi:predicted ATPase
MLREVRITGFRSCKDVALEDLGDLTALVGRNAAGKSNILQAIKAMSRLACQGGADLRVWEDVKPVPSEEAPPITTFSATVVLAERTYRYWLGASQFEVAANPGETKRRLDERLWCQEQDKEESLVFDRKGEELAAVQVGTPTRLAADAPALGTLSLLLPAQAAILSWTEPLQRFFARIGYYPLDESGETSANTARELLVSQENYQRWMADYCRSGSLGKFVPAQIIHLHLSRPDELQTLKDLLGSKGLRLLDEIVIDQFPESDNGTPPRFYIVLFRLHQDAGGDGAFSFGQLSYGTRRILRLLTAVAYGDSSVMLLEHPEDGIHRGLVRKLISLLKTGAYSNQILLSTHSDTVMNELRPEEVRFVSMEDGKTGVRRLSPEEIAAASIYVSSPAGADLSEFLHSVED